MTILRFDEEKLVRELGELPKNLRAAFAASCAQRLLPGYMRYATDSTNANMAALSQALANLWKDIEEDRADVASLTKCHDLCLSLIPGDDKGYVPGQEFAEDAAASVAFVTRVKLTGDSQEAAWAARRAYDALDHYVIERFNVDTAAPAAQLLIDSYPIVQSEFRRQQTDLVELRRIAGNPGCGRTVIERIRRRAESDSASFFG
jgi:hypothetical protein